MDPDSIERTLRQEIESGLLAPGTPLKQEDLADRFGVSRQPVRQALERLRAEGVLRRRADRSLAVAGLSREEAAELVEVRLLLERQALAVSLPLLTATEIRRAGRLCDEILDTDEPARIEELDLAFHNLLYRHCGNRRLLAAIDTLRREGRRIYARQPKGSAWRAALDAQHRALLAAVESRDPKAAANALAAHLMALPAALAGDGKEDRD